MSTATDLSVARVRSLQDRLRLAMQGCVAVETAGLALVRLLFDEFPGRVALARAFATVPYGQLPSFNRDAVVRLASEAGVRGQLRPDTPVLSLLATRGLLPEWNDRRRSAGHVGVPLVSDEFVRSVPMVAALFSELRFTIDAQRERRGAGLRVELVGGEGAGHMYVADARAAVDAERRKIVPAQAFVAEHGIETVFALGGCWPNRCLVAGIVFMRGRLEREVVRRLAPLLSVFRTGTTSLAMDARYFVDGPA
jgi:hypothetical protein